MAKPDEFELLIKMNRLPPPSVLASPLPVKFKAVYYDPKHSDDQLNYDRNKEPSMTKSEAPLQPVTGHIFFKDPLCPPELAVYSGEEAESAVTNTVKLGRNMRASHAQIGTKRRKGVCDLMNERRKLLHQQREQQVELSREADSEQLAAALVNDMMQQGFHITPPEHTPHGNCVSSPNPNPPTNVSSSSPEAENKDGEKRQSVEERRLVAAIHREVKRVTGADSPEEVS